MLTGSESAPKVIHVQIELSERRKVRTLTQTDYTGAVLRKQII